MDQDGHPALPPDSPLMTMTNSFLNDGMLLGLSISGPRLPYRDPTYYINDGNSVLLVENTLFKVRDFTCDVYAGLGRADGRGDAW